MANDEKKDRHRKRHMVPIPPEMYELLRKLADRKGEPTVAAEVRAAIRKHLAEAGLFIQPRKSK